MTPNRQSQSRQQSSGDISVREAGRRGGQTTARTHGRSFYQEIGRLGGEIGGQRVRELIEQGKAAERRGR